jgi:hypothetical protein
LFKLKKTAYNIGKCFLLTEDWITDSWKHRNEIDFDVNGEEFVSDQKLHLAAHLRFERFLSMKTQNKMFCHF